MCVTALCMVHVIVVVLGDVDGGPTARSAKDEVQIVDWLHRLYRRLIFEELSLI